MYHVTRKEQEWVKVQRNHDKNRRKAKFGSRNSDHLDFKANPRRHEFVVFNAPNGCTLEKVKLYIMENDVDVLDIKRLSKEEWNSQSFYISILFKDEPKVAVNQTFGHRTLGIDVFISREDQQNKTIE